MTQTFVTFFGGGGEGVSTVWKFKLKNQKNGRIDPQMMEISNMNIKRDYSNNTFNLRNKDH